MPKIKMFTGLLSALIALPIWFYLLYQILVRVEATELMWFLFWIYLPVAFLVTFLSRVFEND